MTARLWTLALGGLLLASQAFAFDFFDDLVRGGSQNPQQRYAEDVQKAQQNYQEDAYNTEQNYRQSMQEAQTRYQRERQYANTYEAAYRSYQDYVRRVQAAHEKRYERMTQAQRKYYERVQKAQERYYQNLGRNWNQVYNDNHYRQGQVWDRVRRGQHSDEWRYRRDNHYPSYGYDYGQYYWDRDGRQVTHVRTGWDGADGQWWDNQGGSGWYRDYDSDYRWRNRWNLGVHLGVPGGHGYVDRDPYTYSRGRYPQTYYNSHMNRGVQLQFGDENGSFRLSAGETYYGDRYLYGDLYRVR